VSTDESLQAGQELPEWETSVSRPRQQRYLQVQAYTEETGNRIHFDTAYAVRYGLRAPVAPELMAVSWAVEVLSEPAPPDSFDLHAKFGSPLFWDDGVDVMTDGAGATFRVLRLFSSTGALTATVTLEGSV
jgi:hypothetical protein